MVSVLSAVPAQAAPAAPGGLAPSGSSSDHTPLLSWNRVSGAARYEVQVSQSSAYDGSNVVFNRSTSNRRTAVQTPLPTGTLYWRVRGISASGIAGSWGSTTLSLAAQQGPTLLAPANGGSALLQPQNPPVLRWSDVPGAQQYVIEVDTEPDFIGASTYQSQTTSKVVPDAKVDGTYFWHVRAQIAGTNDNTRWSPTWSYSIGGLSPVAVTAPADDPNNGLTDVALDWEPVAGAREYQLRVDNNIDFSSPIDTVTVLSTRYSPPVTYRNDQYYWQVRAVNLNGEYMDWKDLPSPQFRRWWPDKPTLQFPPNSGTTPVGDDFFYQWSPVPHASHYQLEMGTDPNFSPNTYNICRTDQTTYTPGSPIGDACMPSQGVTYYWRVLPVDAPSNVPGLYSDIHTFIYDSGRVMQLAPTNGATVAVPTLSWQASQDAERYRVEVKNKYGNVVAGTDTYALSWTPTGALDPTQSAFTWTVQAIDSDGRLSPKYAGRSFNLSGSPATTGAAPLTPLSPASSEAGTQRFPALSWEPVSGAKNYRVRMSPHGSPFMYPDSESPLLSTSVAYPSATDWGSRFLSPGSYDWWVDAYDGNGQNIGTSPSVGTFQILDLNKAGNLQVALTGLGLNRGEGCKAVLSDISGAPTTCDGAPSTPVLDWDPVPEAAFYMVYISRDKAFTNLIYNGVNTRTTNSRWTPSQSYAPSSMPDNNAGEAYYWLVRPCKAENRCAPDPLSTTNPADNSFSKQSPQVGLVNPTDAGVAADDVRFDWTDYRSTNAATPWLVGMADKSQQSGQRYRIEISQSDNFSSTNGSFYRWWEVDQTTFTPYDDTLPEGKLYWHVAAIDNANNRLRWSPTRTFTKTSPRPVLTSPTVGDTVSVTPVFRWDPLNFAGQYQIEVYRNNDTAFSDGNRVIQQNVTQTAFANWVPLAPSSAAYVWRVRRLDSRGRPGAWSATGKFFVASKAPTLGYPSSGSYVTHQDAYFTWDPVVGAKRYRFERRVAGSSGLVESVDTAGTSWASEDIPDGTYEWRVTAFDAVDNVLGVTDWRTFKVDATRPTVTSKSPSTRAYRTSNFVARFSESVWGVSSTTMRIYKKGSTSAISARVTLDSTRRTATLNPSVNLRSGATYYVRFTGSRIKDRAGNQLVVPSWTVRVR